MHARYQMGVDVERDRHARMPKRLLYDFGMSALRQRHGSVTVAQIMKATREAQFLAEVQKGLGDPAGAERAAEQVATHQANRGRPAADLPPGGRGDAAVCPRRAAAARSSGASARFSVP
jgi:hypothetical protein